MSPQKGHTLCIANVSSLGIALGKLLRNAVIEPNNRRTRENIE
jgi:hypothetical protein